jgi:replicative superfamily II helicase
MNMVRFPCQTNLMWTAAEQAVVQVVAAPTGSGKTGVMELAMLRVFSKQISPQGSFQSKQGAVKIVYLAPMRALVQQKLQEWTERFGSVLGLKCLEVTGDSDPDPLELEQADILCSTPEKFGTSRNTTASCLSCLLCYLDSSASRWIQHSSSS